MSRQHVPPLRVHGTVSLVGSTVHRMHTVMDTAYSSDCGTASCVC